MISTVVDYANGWYVLDVNKLNRDEPLQPGSVVRLPCVVDGVKHSYEVSLTWTACHYGGARPWFVCPNVHCGGRAGTLYRVRTPYYLCRRCQRLRYRTQSEKPLGRALILEQNLRVRLGGSWDLSEPFPARPKGMHRTTYQRLRERAAEASWRSLWLWPELRGWLDLTEDDADDFGET